MLLATVSMAKTKRCHKFNVVNAASTSQKSHSGTLETLPLLFFCFLFFLKLALSSLSFQPPFFFFSYPIRWYLLHADSFHRRFIIHWNFIPRPSNRERREKRTGTERIFFVCVAVFYSFSIIILPISTRWLPAWALAWRRTPYPVLLYRPMFGRSRVKGQRKITQEEKQKIENEEDLSCLVFLSHGFLRGRFE